jgi:hypothetical protein
VNGYAVHRISVPIITVKRSLPAAKAVAPRPRAAIADPFSATAEVLYYWCQVLEATETGAGGEVLTLGDPRQNAGQGGIRRDMGGYAQQNALAQALQEYGRLERTLHVLRWYANNEDRRRVSSDGFLRVERAGEFGSGSLRS